MQLKTHLTILWVTLLLGCTKKYRNLLTISGQSINPFGEFVIFSDNDPLLEANL